MAPKGAYFAPDKSLYPTNNAPSLDSEAITYNRIRGDMSRGLTRMYKLPKISNFSLSKCILNSTSEPFVAVVAAYLEGRKVRMLLLSMTTTKNCFLLTD